MSDIVERLRAHDARVYEEAADEIERGEKKTWIAWAAGLFEGEGAICEAQKFKIVRNENGERRKSGYRWWLVLHSADEDVIRRFQAVVGVGKLYGPYRDKRSDAYKPQWRWTTTTLHDSQTVLRLLVPYLGVRRGQKAAKCLEAIYVRKCRSTGIAA